MIRPRLAAAGPALLLVVAAASAQDFTSPGRPGPARTATAFLEHALPPVSAGPLAGVALASWYAVPGLETRSAAAGSGRGPVRFAVGLSQTGEPAVGWGAAGLACGVARPDGGAALRVVARRDRAIEPGSAAALRLEERAGLEAGWGAWLSPRAGVRIWVSGPQAWSRGTAPPLERPLAVGGSLARDDLAFWLVRTAPAAGGAAEHEAGAALGSGPLSAWVSARDGPLRGGFGLEARLGRLALAGSVESHPDLGETVRLSLGLVERE